MKPVGRDKGNGLYRRSLYTSGKRTGPAPTMMILGAAKRDVCRVRRERTASPLQAFVLLNDPQFVEAARVLAELVVREHETKKARIVAAFRRLTSRVPSKRELAVLRRLLDRQLARFAQDQNAAAALLSVGERKPEESADRGTVAAYTVVCSTKVLEQTTRVEALNSSQGVAS